MNWFHAAGARSCLWCCVAAMLGGCPAVAAPPAHGTKDWLIDRAKNCASAPPFRGRGRGGKGCVLDLDEPTVAEPRTPSWDAYGGVDGVDRWVVHFREIGCAWDFASGLSLGIDGAGACRVLPQY